MRADSGGAFEFRGLSPGTYRIVASKSGYEPIVADAPPLGLRILYSGRSVTLAAGETTDPIDVPLAPLATLSGVVRDDNGDPLLGASVQLLTIRYEAGRRQVVPAEVAARVTDDAGRYRLFGLAPGQYVVSASIGSVSSADVSGFVRSYFPVGISVGARLLPDGQFEFPNVPPGEYVIQASRGRSNPSTEGAFGALPIVVSGADVTDLVLAMSTGSTVSGSIRFDTINADKRPSPGTVEISSFPVDFDFAPWNGFATADVRADRQFQMTGLHGPRRLRVERVPSGWALKEILANGVDATDRAFVFGAQNSSLADVEVVLTDRVSGVGGTVADPNGKPVDGASVIAFAADRDRWYPASRFFSMALTGPDGLFAITGLPAGSYYLAVLLRLPPDNTWQEPAFLDDLRREANAVTIAEGQRVSVTLHPPRR